MFIEVVSMSVYFKVMNLLRDHLMLDKQNHSMHITMT